MKAVCERLSQRVDEREVRHQRSEQYSQNLNVEVKGTAVQRDEDLMKIVKDEGMVVGEPIQEDDVEIGRNVPAPNSDSRNVAVQFLRHTKCKGVLPACTDRGFAASGPVFVNKHLCPSMKKLLGQAGYFKKRRKSGHLCA